MKRVMRYVAIATLFALVFSAELLAGSGKRLEDVSCSLYVETFVTDGMGWSGVDLSPSQLDELTDRGFRPIEAWSIKKENRPRSRRGASFSLELYLPVSPENGWRDGCQKMGNDEESYRCQAEVYLKDQRSKDERQFEKVSGVRKSKAATREGAETLLLDVAMFGFTCKSKSYPFDG